MSPRAAWRLESLGFTQVFDYVAGKMGWFASGLPREGKLAVGRVGDIVRHDVPTCRLDNHLNEVRKQVIAAGQEVCVVVNDENVVFGRLSRDTLHSEREGVIETVMESGPSTFRPHVSLKEMLDYMQKRGLDDALITTADGRLLGLLYRADVEEALRDAEIKRALARP